jgi:hypothetical protein
MFHSTKIEKYAKPKCLKSKYLKTIVACALAVGCQSAVAWGNNHNPQPGDLTDVSYVGFQSKQIINQGVEERGLGSVIEPASCKVLSLKINYLSEGVEPNEDGPLEELSAT